MLKHIQAAAQIIVALAALGAFILSASNHFQIQKVEHTFNSQMTRFLVLVEKTAKAAGVKQERERQEDLE